MVRGEWMGRSRGVPPPMRVGRTLQIPVSSLHVASSWSATTEPSPFNFLRSVSYSSSLRIGFPIRYRLLAIMNLISSFEKSCASGREGWG